MFYMPRNKFSAHGLPIVTISIILVNVIVFLYEMTLNDLETFQFNSRFGLIPWELTSGQELGVLHITATLGIDVKSPWPTWTTIFTSIFIHASVMHIMLNMLFLGLFGNYVESRLGHMKYLLLFLATGVAAAWTQISINQDTLAPLIGASGAVSGVMGAYLLIYPQALAFMAIYFLGQLLYGIGSLTTFGPVTDVAYMAHVGGFVSGILLMAGYKLLSGNPIWPGDTGSPWSRYR